MGSKKMIEVLRCRMIGEVYGSATVWGWELYVAYPDSEQSYGRWLGVTEDQERVRDFCRRINNGMVSSTHAEDLIQDFHVSLIDR